LFVKPDRLRT